MAVGTRGGVGVQLQLALKYRLVPRYGKGRHTLLVLTTYLQYLIS
jgi:hypothetical protein